MKNNIKLFTLLETIVATAIFAVVMMTIGMMFFSINASRNKIKTYKKNIDNIVAIDKLFSNSFRNAIHFYWKDENNKDSSIFIGKENYASFAFKHRINHYKDAGIRFISYSLDNNNLIATYSDTPIVPWLESQDNLKTEILLTNIENISFIYAARNENTITWLESWDEENENIPLAIQITILWKDGSQEQWLNRVAGASLYETLGKRNDDEL